MQTYKYLPLLAIALTGCTMNLLGWEVTADIEPYSKRAIVSARTEEMVGVAALIDLDNVGFYAAGRLGKERGYFGGSLNPEATSYSEGK